MYWYLCQQHLCERRKWWRHQTGSYNKNTSGLFKNHNKLTLQDLFPIFAFNVNVTIGFKLPWVSLQSENWKMPCDALEKSVTDLTEPHTLHAMHPVQYMGSLDLHYNTNRVAAAVRLVRVCMYIKHGLGMATCSVLHRIFGFGYCTIMAEMYMAWRNLTRSHCFAHRA